MEKNIGKAVAEDLYKVLADARASFSAEERQEYDPQTLAEMFQYQINVNIRAAAEAHSRNKQPEIAAKLLAYADHTFPDYNDTFNVTASADEGKAVAKLVKKAINDIGQLPALENEEPFDPNPWPNYNEILGVDEAARQAKADIRSVKNIIADSKKLPLEKTDPETGADKHISLFRASQESLRKMLGQKDGPSNKDRRQPNGPQPV